MEKNNNQLILNRILSLIDKKVDNSEKVVYFIIEIVKYLELNKRKQDFIMLSFYRDWISHAYIDRNKTAGDLLVSLESKIKKGYTGTQIAKEFINNSKEFFTLETLKAELFKFLNENNLPNDLVTKKHNWEIFIKSLFEILEETPIVIQESGSKISSIKSIKLIKDKNHNPTYKFSLSVTVRCPSIKIKLK